MTSRLVRSCFVAGLSALVVDAPAQTPAPGGALPQNPPATAPRTPAPAAGSVAPGVNRPTAPSVRPAPPEDVPVQLKLPDADIDTVLTTLEALTGRIILRPAQLTTATYNLRIAEPIPKSEAILAIETVLALNNIGIAPLGERFIKVVDLTKVRGEAPEMITGSALDLPPSGKVASKLFQLEFARVQELIPLFSGVLNPFYGGPIPMPNANAVLITDSISNLQRLELLLQQLDKPITAGMKAKFYNVRNVKASELVNKLRTILTGTLQTQLGSATTYSADDRTQQIVVVTDPRQWDFFSELIDRLDQKSDPNTRNEVLYLKNAKAVDVVNVLSRIISGQTTALQRQNTGSVRPGQQPTQPGLQPNPAVPNQPPQPTVVSASAANNPNLDLMGSGANEFSALMTVVNDDRSNSVVVFGTSDDIRLVRELVEKLDIVLAQVRIEVVIAEVTLNDQDTSGISALGLKIDGDKLVGFSGTAAGVSVANGVVTRPGTSGHMDLAGEIAISATPRKSNSTIMSVPAIVTSHGKKSTITSGEKRPIITGSVNSGINGGTTSTTTLTQIGTTLEVTPFIGSDGSVQLELKQTVEDVVDRVVIDGNEQPVIGSRETTSYVTARSGEVRVLGGFTKRIDSKSRSRLGPIPIIGDIFGPRTKQNYRQELIFFLRPTVVTNEAAADNPEILRRLNQLPARDEIKKEIDPNYASPPPRSVLDKILPR